MTKRQVLILASASPRRQELLRQIGCEFRVVVSEAEEIFGDGVPPEVLAVENARRKAEDVASHEGGNVPVLGADTVVMADGKVMGKPKDAADAVRMLRFLSGQQHFVYTGIVIMYHGKAHETVVRTTVWMDVLSDAEIDAYVSTGEPMDKAGAYAVQGRAAQFIPRIDGSFSNVVGLPLHAVRELARKAGVVL